MSVYQQLTRLRVRGRCVYNSYMVPGTSWGECAGSKLVHRVAHSGTSLSSSYRPSPSLLTLTMITATTRAARPIRYSFSENSSISFTWQLWDGKGRRVTSDTPAWQMTIKRFYCCWSPSDHVSCNENWFCPCKIIIISEWSHMSPLNYIKDCYVITQI